MTDSRVGAAAQEVAQLLADFDRALAMLDERIAAPPADAGTPAPAPRDPAACLAAAEEALRALEQEAAERRRDAEEEARLAADYEHRAVLAIDAGRGDTLVRGVIRAAAEHAERAARDAQVAAHLEAALAEYRRALDELRPRLARGRPTA